MFVSPIFNYSTGIKILGQLEIYFPIEEYHACQTENNKLLPLPRLLIFFCIRLPYGSTEFLLVSRIKLSFHQTLCFEHCDCGILVFQVTIST